jgi:AcrR family transcriptional regulator
MHPPVEPRSETHDVRVNVHGDETRHALVLAAIKVIAENGVEGASLRAINVAAGCRNSSAAHYHFGNKLTIIEAALAAIYGEVQRIQEPLLSALEDRVRFGRPVSAREVLEAGYLPYLALLSRPEFGPTAAKFVSRLLVESNNEIQAILNRTVSPMMLRALALLRAALPQIPEEALKLRMFISITNVIHGAGDFAAIQNSPFGDLSGDNPLAILHSMFEYITAAVSSPVAPLTTADETRMASSLF